MDTFDTATASVRSEDEFWGWYNSYLTAMIGISIFGGQITFSIVISDFADPSEVVQSSDPNWQPVFQKQTIRTFLAISWLLFTFTLAMALVAKMLGSEPSTRRWFRHAFGETTMHSLMAATTILLEEVPVSAFLFLALSVTPYVPVVGWIGVGGISLFMIFLAILWFRLWFG
ncbi:hypothetical protein GQ53DRAFT_227388 [Thozetella sp. PMI_491]|nr:hypothetical protein GQ53DRAFT_227388 [Thozetella sp. PMI_491]